MSSILDQNKPLVLTGEWIDTFYAGSDPDELAENPDKVMPVHIEETIDVDSYNAAVQSCQEYIQDIRNMKSWEMHMSVD